MERKLRWWEHPLMWGLLLVLACGGIHHRLTAPREDVL